MKDVIIIGAGASGLVCAITLARRGKNVLLIEKQDKIGKKLLATGNGRCNLTNLAGFDNAYNRDLTTFFDKFDNDQTINFFTDLGLWTYSDEEGRVYPISNTATSVVDVLRLEIERLGICVNVGEVAQYIKKEVDMCVVKTDKSEYMCRNVVIAVGGNAGKGLLSNFNVNYVEDLPVLASLKTEKLGMFNGIRQSNVVIEFMGFLEKGEVLFKESAISGIVVFNLSWYMAKNNINSGEISIDLLPNHTAEQILKILNLRISKCKNIEDLLVGIFHKEIAKFVLKKSNISICDNVADLTPKKLEILCKAIKGLKIKVKGFCDNNQVFTGGINIDDVNENLMIKKHPGIYVSGEAINVFGRCGGYNLQWAFTSGKIIGDNI